jgi:pimeloyl-ACP methyl ester carboxylesterase
MEKPTLVLVPCLTGAPWQVEQLSALSDLPLVTLRLNTSHRGIEEHANDVLELAQQYDKFILVGDSFGAQIALAAAARRPRRLAGLVMSGGFAANPIDDVVTKLKARAAGFAPGPLYQNVVLPMHAALLASRFDSLGDHGWSRRDTIRLFRENTPWKTYVYRTQAAMGADYRFALPAISVPTLIVTPEDDTLIGPRAAGEMLRGISGARETVIEKSGHMFRFSHPRVYSTVIRSFIDAEKLSVA